MSCVVLVRTYQRLRLLSIMPNRPVRDKWDYPRKMERHFPIKPRQPIRNSSCHFLSFPNSLIRAKNRFVKNGTANFDRNIPTEISGPPPKVIPNIPVGRNRNGPFHLNSYRNFRNLWHNGNLSLEMPRSIITWAISNMLWVSSILFGWLVAIWIDGRKLDEKKAFLSVELL